MPFIPSGKKAKKKLQREKRTEVRDRFIDGVVGAILMVMQQRPRTCLPTCFLVERMLSEKLPGHGFTQRLGSLHVVPVDPAIDPISFDPRGRDGIDGGFHSWLEDGNGELIDPSIFQTLVHDGYDVDPLSYVSNIGRDFVFDGLRMIYEELPGLELVGVEESKPHLAALLEWANTGIPPKPGTAYLDLQWRAGHQPQPEE